MKAPNFQYIRAKTVEEVCVLLAEHEDAQVLAGGQSLVAAMNMRLASPDVLIDINHIEGLSDIFLSKSDTLIIGPTARHIQVRTSPIISQYAPLLTQALEYVAHPSIQNRGTHCGSIALADPAAEMPACALALGARMELQSIRGKRMVAAEDFFLGLYETARQPDELLLGVHYPLTSNRLFGFGEITPRHGDFPQVGLAVNVSQTRDHWENLRIVVFACEPRPRLLQDVAAVAHGHVANSDFFSELADVVATKILPMDHHEVRRYQVRGLAQQVFEVTA